MDCVIACDLEPLYSSLSSLVHVNQLLSWNMATLLRNYAKPIPLIISKLSILSQAGADRNKTSYFRHFSQKGLELWLLVWVISKSWNYWKKILIYVNACLWIWSFCLCVGHFFFSFFVRCSSYFFFNFLGIFILLSNPLQNISAILYLNIWWRSCRIQHLYLRNKIAYNIPFLKPTAIDVMY